MSEKLILQVNVLPVEDFIGYNEVTEILVVGII
jgi:hypothetical protein